MSASLYKMFFAVIAGKRRIRIAGRFSLTAYSLFYYIPFVLKQVIIIYSKVGVHA